MRLRYKYYSLQGGMQKVKTRTALAISAVTLALSGGTGLSLLAFSSAHAEAGSTVTVTAADTQGWGVADQRAGGDYAFVKDTSSPLPSGALQLTTDGDSHSKLQYMHAADLSLTDLTEASYSTKQNSGPAVAAASYQVAVDLNGAADGGFTTLVYEPYWNGTVTNGNWQQWDVASSIAKLWSSRSFSDGNGCSVVAGGGGAPFYSLTQLQSDCPDAVVVGFGVNVGSGNLNYNVEVDGVNFNATTYDFQYTTAAGEITAPTAGEHVSGTLNLAANYVDNETTNTDGVQWAVREGTCAAGTNTVFGNVDGHHDAYSWNGNDFAASLDVRNVTPGEYCFIFNPTDDPGQPNVRETVSFFVDQYYVQTPQDCKHNGWMALHTADNGSFKNQGQCVSYANHNDGVGRDDVHAKNR